MKIQNDVYARIKTGGLWCYRYLLIKN